MAPRIIVPGRGRLSRRTLLQAGGLSALGVGLAACGGSADEPGASADPEEVEAAAPEETFTDPASQLSGDLSILLWSHFVPSHDEWFAPFAQRWGEQVGVNVTVDHINNTEIPARLASEIQAGQGHDIIQYIAPLSQFEPSVLDLKDINDEAVNRFGEQLGLCQKSSFNPATGKYYAFAPGWAPDPGNYRRSLWEPVGYPDGPATFDELLDGGSQIRESQGVQLGVGMSQEIDSNMFTRALMWGYGSSIQDENEQVTINSPETVAAVEFMAQLFQQAMTNEVFSWNPASNNQGLVSGQMSFIWNSISAFRTAQSENPDVAEDIFFVPALQGPVDKRAAQHVMYNYIIPTHAANADAAKEFLLHFAANFASVSWHSKLYDLPAFNVAPDLGDWLSKDPFAGDGPPDKLAFLQDAAQWSVNIGYPGPANTAEGEVFNTFIIPNMFARAARGELSPADTVAQAETQIVPIFDKWRQQGLVGGA